MLETLGTLHAYRPAAYRNRHESVDLHSLVWAGTSAETAGTIILVLQNRITAKRATTRPRRFAQPAAAERFSRLWIKTCVNPVWQAPL
jgi:hypothetical protein